jgi:hypothetical protein
MRELIVAANLFVGTYDGTYFIYNYKNELKQIDIAIIQFPPPPLNEPPITLKAVGAFIDCTVRLVTSKTNYA